MITTKRPTMGDLADQALEALLAKYPRMTRLRAFNGPEAMVLRDQLARFLPAEFVADQKTTAERAAMLVWHGAIERRFGE